MQLNPGEKKAVAIIAAVAVAFVLIVGGSVAFLTKDSWSGKQQFGAIDRGDHLYVQLAVGDRLIRVEPTRMCDVFLKECRPAGESDITPTRVPVTPGDSIMVSVSEGIARWPWKLVVQVLTPHGLEGTEIPFESGSKRTTVLHSTPDRVILIVEVALPSAVKASESDYISRGVFSVDTKPEGLRLPTEN